TLAGLHRTPGLHRLYLKQCKLQDWHSLLPMQELQELYLSADHLAPLSALAHLPGLRRLHLTARHAHSTAGLEALGQLEELTLTGAQALADVSPLGQLGHLKKLALPFSALTSIDFARDMQALEVLDLRGTPLAGRLNPAAWPFRLILA
ncbi:MAG: hypothetical protein ACK5XP_09100, partial [Sphingobacteriia bacterium]